MSSSTVRTMSPEERAWSRSLISEIDTEIIGLPLWTFRQVSSTNDEIKDLVMQGAPEGLTVIAHEQKQGRGQAGRTWESFPGKGVYLSFLLKPTHKGGDTKWMAIFGALAAAETLKHFGVPGITVKWPNDVLAGGKKIAGVLVEPRVGQEKVYFAVIGIGINVAHAVDDWSDELKTMATSCHIEGEEVSCDAVIIQIIHRLDYWYGIYRTDGYEPLHKAWEQLGGIVRESDA